MDVVRLEQRVRRRPNQPRGAQRRPPPDIERREDGRVAPQLLARLKGLGGVEGVVALLLVRKLRERGLVVDDVHDSSGLLPQQLVATPHGGLCAVRPPRRPLACALHEADRAGCLHRNAVILVWRGRMVKALRRREARELEARARGRRVEWVSLFLTGRRRAMDTLQRKTGQVFGNRAPHTGLQGLELHLKRLLHYLSEAGAHAFKIIFLLLLLRKKLVREAGANLLGAHETPNHTTLKRSKPTL